LRRVDVAGNELGNDLDESSLYSRSSTTCDMEVVVVLTSRKVLMSTNISTLTSYDDLIKGRCLVLRRDVRDWGRPHVSTLLTTCLVLGGLSRCAIAGITDIGVSWSLEPIA